MTHAAESPNTAWNGTSAAHPAEPTITFDEMARLVRDMTREQILKEIRVHPAAYTSLLLYTEELRQQQQHHFGQPRPEAPVNLYAGVHVRIDETLEPGQWQAIDTKDNVMEEGNLLPEWLRW